MEVDSQKTKEWVGITNEPSCKFTIGHVCVLLFKGPTHLLCLFCFAPIPLYFVLPYLVCSILPLAP
jgi:hypothetical protein